MRKLMVWWFEWVELRVVHCILSVYFIWTFIDALHYMWPFHKFFVVRPLVTLFLARISSAGISDLGKNEFFRWEGKRIHRGSKIQVVSYSSPCLVHTCYMTTDQARIMRHPVLKPRVDAIEHNYYTSFIIHSSSSSRIWKILNLDNRFIFPEPRVGAVDREGERERGREEVI